MSQGTHVLAIDQGTTSTRAIVFDPLGVPVTTAQREFSQHYPNDGWVEHNPEEIWRDTIDVCQEVIATSGLNVLDIAAIGITNQRETAVIWDRATGQPIYNAIVWQDRRMAPFCRDLAAQGHADLIQQRTGLVVDAYFSASKIKWILDHVDGARARADRGELAFGTIDTFLLWRLTGGLSHATDATNACRTMLFNLHTQDWDDEVLALFDIPRVLLPRVMDSSAAFGETVAAHFGRAIPITGIAGDQQAATVGQACFERGTMKSTYGTGCFALLNTGEVPVISTHKMLTTIAYRLDGKPTFAVEGSIFVAGAAIKWLRDGFRVIGSAHETAELAAMLPDNHGVYLVPAFVGLGAPYWDPEARAAITGLTLDASPAHLARAALEAVAYQTRDLIHGMEADAGTHPAVVRVDGGMVVNDWLCQFLADILDTPVERPTVTETTALGAAYLAGLKVGMFKDLGAISMTWTRDRLFEPRMNADLRQSLYAGWVDAVDRTLSRSAG